MGEIPIIAGYQHCHIMSTQSNYPFLVIWNDTPDEVGICVSKSWHELGELLFVEETNSSEHALLGTLPKCCIVVVFCCCHSNDLSYSNEKIKSEKKQKLETK